MIEHIKNNKLLIITIVLLSLSDNFLKFPSLGTIWISLNANSLIGIQKLIENNFYNSDVFINLLSYEMSTIFVYIFIYNIFSNYHRISYNRKIQIFSIYFII